MPTAKTPPYERYLNTHYGQALLKKHSLEETGLWQVWGEDPNCDFGGAHVNPFLGTFEGRLADVLTEVVELGGFWQWGSGGKVEKTTPKQITPLVKTVSRNTGRNTIKYPTSTNSSASMVSLFDLILQKTKEGKIDWGEPNPYQGKLVGSAPGTGMKINLEHHSDQREGDWHTMTVSVDGKVVQVGTEDEMARLWKLVVETPTKVAESAAREILESL
jgi:hypothetical protein